MAQALTFAQLDTFARHLTDVYRGLLRVGWDESAARDFVDGLNENRYDVIKLRKEVAALKVVVARQGKGALE